MTSQSRRLRREKCGNDCLATGKEKLKLRSFDDSIYIVYYDGDIFRAYHSDFAETPVRDCPGPQLERSKVCLRHLEIVGRRQELEIAERQRQGGPKENQGLSHHSCIPDKNASNPELFGEEIEFKKRETVASTCHRTGSCL